MSTGPWVAVSPASAGRLGLTMLLFLLSACVPLKAAEPDDATALATRIDAAIQARWQKRGVVPAAAASDAEFLRRASLHIGGCIPEVATTRRFLADPSPDKRRQLVDHLLDSAGYVVNYSHFWRKAMLPEAGADRQAAQYGPGFEAWLRQELTDNTSYDVLVRSILTASPAADRRARDTAGVAAFRQSRQNEAPELATATARVFLGVRIDCAQCHDHPFDTWKQDDFWSMAAFFTGIRFTAAAFEGTEFRGPTIAIPDQDRTATATFLDGTRPDWAADTSTSQVMAEWVTSPGNPYFARATVNRLWGYFFGRGLVDPVDDFSAANPASHPELLDLLAAEFVAHQYDLKFLIRAITASQAYQLSSVQSDPAQNDPQLFAVMPVQWLSPEQISDSFALATGTRRQFTPYRGLISIQSGGSVTLESLFGEDGRSPTEREVTILQALALMNGNDTTRATNLRTSRTLAAVADAPFLNNGQKIETLFLAALSRLPTDRERERLTAYVESGGPAQEPHKALEDVFWSLLNSSEFLLNH